MVLLSLLSSEQPNQFLILILLPFYIIIPYLTFFRVLKKKDKTPEEALKLLLLDIYLTGGTGENLFENVNICADRLLKTLPQKISPTPSELADCIKAFRLVLIEPLFAEDALRASQRQNESTKPNLGTKALARPTIFSKNLKIDALKELYPNVVEVSATLEYEDGFYFHSRSSRNNT
jgi:hypothetical protein